MNIRIIWKVNKEIQHVKHVERNKYATEKTAVTAQTMKFSVKDFFCKCDQIRRKLWICSLLPKNSFLVFCAVGYSSSSHPAGNYMFKVNNRNTRTRCEICSKLTIKIPERHHWRRSSIFIVTSEHILHLVLVLLLLTLST